MSGTGTRRRRLPRYRISRGPGRKVDQIVGDRVPCTAADRRRQDMAAVGIGKFERPDRWLVSGDQRLRKMLVHGMPLGADAPFKMRLLFEQFRVHSSRIRSVHRPRNNPAWWKRKRMSLLRNGNRTFASGRATRRSAGCFKTHRTPGQDGRDRRAPHGARHRGGPCRPSGRRAGRAGAHRPKRTASCPS